VHIAETVDHSHIKNSTMVGKYIKVLEEQVKDNE